MGHMMTLDSDFLFENLCNKSGVMTSDSLAAADPVDQAGWVCLKGGDYGPSRPGNLIG